LADARFHSGEELSSALGVSRSAVWKATGTLKELGVTVHAVRNRGYRIPETAEPLQAAKIRDRLPREDRERVRTIETVWSTSSTNTVLLELRAESGGPACVVIGIGLNVALGAALLERIAGMGLEATDLRTAGLATPSRNSIAAALVSACLRGLAAFEREGLKPFIEEW